MTNQMPHQGPHDHDHGHDHPQMPPLTVQAQDVMAEAVHAGAEQWLAREFVGGLVALADAHGVNPADFLAEKCMLLSLRVALAESEVEVLRTRITVLDSKLAECGCDDTSTSVQPDEIFTGIPQDVPSTNNGDGTT